MRLLALVQADEDKLIEPPLPITTYAPAMYVTFEFRNP